MEEFFEIHDVKNEFLKNVGPQYQSTYLPQQLDIALYMLNDFCNNISANGLLLVRPPQPQPQPQPQQPYYQQPYYQEPYPQPPYAQQQMPVQRPRPMPQAQMPMQNPFTEYDEESYDVQRQVAEMNRGIRPQQFVQPQPQPQPQQFVQPRRPQPTQIPSQQPPQQPVSEVDLRAEKPKTFVDKIKEMRTPKKVDKINPEE